MLEGISSSDSIDSSGNLSSTQTAAQVSQDEFLKLLTYQLKNQNPLKPYDNQEFASQLAQFSQLEQLTDIKSLMEEQVQTNLILTQTISNTALPGLIGKGAKAMMDTVGFDGDNPVNIGYSLTTQAASATLTISDEYGNTVRTMDLTDLDLLSGDHKLEWDGTDDGGETLPAGTYAFEVEAFDGDGTSTTADAFTYGTIEAVRFKTDGTKLVINGVEVPLENVMDITTDA